MENDWNFQRSMKFEQEAPDCTWIIVIVGLSIELLQKVTS
jgi:hypothetical protein